MLHHMNTVLAILAPYQLPSVPTTLAVSPPNFEQSEVNAEVLVELDLSSMTPPEVRQVARVFPFRFALERFPQPGGFQTYRGYFDYPGATVSVILIVQPGVSL